MPMLNRTKLNLNQDLKEEVKQAVHTWVSKPRSASKKPDTKEQGRKNHWTKIGLKIGYLLLNQAIPIDQKFPSSVSRRSF